VKGGPSRGPEKVQKKTHPQVCSHSDEGLEKKPKWVGGREETATSERN